MSGTNPPPDSDSEQGALTEDPLEHINTAIKRSVASYVAKRSSDLNQQVPVTTFDKVTGERQYEFLPQAVPRKFASPLKLFGSTPAGPNGERLVTSGYGDTRSVKYEPPPDGNRRHGGVDFRAAVGENVLASGDGIVTFTGFQRRTGPRDSVRHAHVDSSGNVLDQAGDVVASPKDLGHGGVYVEITHDGDFHGYVTQYMHLSEITTTSGTRVLAGDVIGKVGRTGGVGGITTGPHLHWQVRYNRKIAPPEPLVAHYTPGEPDANNPSLGQLTAFVNAAVKSLPAGAATVANGAVNQLQALARAADAENKTSAQLKAAQADHSQLAAKKLSMRTGAVYDAMAKFQGTLPKVSKPMVFDFVKGTWSDGKAV